MGLMRNLVKRNGVWTVRVGIPVDVRAAYGKNIEWISLRTTDELVATHAHANVAGDVIADRRDRADLRQRKEEAVENLESSLLEMRPKEGRHVTQPRGSIGRPAPSDFVVSEELGNHWMAG